MSEHTGEGELLSEPLASVTLESVVEDSLSRLETKFNNTNFTRVQRAMELAREYLSPTKFQGYVVRYADFMASYKVKYGR